MLPETIILRGSPHVCISTVRITPSLLAILATTTVATCIFVSEHVNKNVNRVSRSAW